MICKKQSSRLPAVSRPGVDEAAKILQQNSAANCNGCNELRFEEGLTDGPEDR